jgi:hypothetical protein
LLALSGLSWSALRSGPTLVALLELWRATRTLLAELLLLARQALLTLSGLARSALRSSPALAALLELWRATRALLAELFLLTRQSLLALSRLPAWLSAALATLLELWRATRSLLAELLLLAGQALLALTPLLAGLATWAFWLSTLTALWPAGLAFILLFALVLGILTLCNDQTAICSTGAVKRDAQLRNRNRRDQGAGEQDVAKLLQLPDRFEWQGALLGILKGASLRCAAAAPIRGTI